MDMVASGKLQMPFSCDSCSAIYRRAHDDMMAVAHTDRLSCLQGGFLTLMTGGQMYKIGVGAS